MADTLKQNYELAFQISSNLEEADVQKTRQELEKAVTSHGGVVSFSKDLERTRLAYPIKHQTNAFFGYLNFNLESGEAVHQIRDELRLNPHILRFLILKQEEESKMKQEDVIRRLAIAEKRRIRAMKQAEKPAASKGETPKASEKEIDEKLEEIIEKL
ncbi:MAG: 30S ribosomal protein S6 [Candidatus Taylorbacteria bacterium]|nr:30S ribosomal protein S6 [Candidatus Taylorbacteria bacterium]